MLLPHIATIEFMPSASKYIHKLLWDVIIRIGSNFSAGSSIDAAITTYINKNDIA